MPVRIGSTFLVNPSAPPRRVRIASTFLEAGPPAPGVPSRVRIASTHIYAGQVPPIPGAELLYQWDPDAQTLTPVRNLHLWDPATQTLVAT